MKGFGMFPLLALFALNVLPLLPQSPPHSITLSWDWSQGSGGPATGFNVKRGTVSGSEVTIGSTVYPTMTYVDPFQFTDEGGTLYYVVTAVGPSGESSPSPEASAIIPFLAPQAPQQLLISQNISSVLSVKQFCKNSAFTNALTCTTGSNITAGNELWAIMQTNDSSLTFSTPTGCGVTWSLVNTATGSNYRGAIYKAPITSGAACTITTSMSGSTDEYVGLWEIAGGTGTVDATTPIFVGNTTFCTVCNGHTISLTPTTNNAMLLYLYGSTNSDTLTAISSFTLDAQGPGSSYSAAGMHQLQTTATAGSPNFTQPGADSFNEGMVAIH